MSTDKIPAYMSHKRCAFCKYFTMHFNNLDPKSQRCKKYNKPTKMNTVADDCKGYKKKE